MSATREARIKTVAGDPSAAKGLLLVDPYNDFLSEGGKLWPLVKPIAEEENPLEHLRQILAAARAGGVPIFVVPHHRAEPKDYAGWRQPTPYQRSPRGPEPQE